MATFSADVFSTCAPAYSTNVKQCGTVTVCTAKPLQSGDLSGVFISSSEYRVMEAILMHDFEVKMCNAVQNGLYDFFMANRVNLGHKVSTDKINAGLLAVRPFVLGRRINPINNEYWIAYNGGPQSGGNYAYDVISESGMPLDVRWFNESERIYMDGLDSNVSTKTAWVVVSATLGTAVIVQDGGDPASADVIKLVLTPANAGSYLPAARLEPPVAGTPPSEHLPIAVVRRGTANISDYESFCSESAGVINWNDSPYWIETTRDAFCTDELYEQWRTMLLEQNPLYREYGDLDAVRLNKQLAADWQKRWVNNVFYGKPLNANQRIASYTSLPNIETVTSAYIDTGGARCVGKRANAVGIYEQLAECERLCDANGATLNMLSLFNELYNIMRVRAGLGNKVESIDIFTDMQTAHKINQAMLTYYKNESQDQLRLVMDVNGDFKKAEFGFRYRQYTLFYPAGLVINVVTHYFFDDALSAATKAGVTNTGRVLWVLDLANIYPGIIASDQKVYNKYQLDQLAQIDGTFACTMKLPTAKQRLTSLQYTVIVECPRANLVIENFSSAVPAVTVNDDVVYPCPE